MIEMGVFREELGKLAVNFGVAKVDDKIDFFWSELKDVNEMVFRDACRSILEHGERFPKLKDFKEAIGGATLKMQSHLAKPAVECDDCDGTGLVTKYRQVGEWRGQKLWGGFVFRCHCAAGLGMSHVIQPNIPPYTDGFISREAYHELAV